MVTAHSAPACDLPRLAGRSCGWRVAPRCEGVGAARGGKAMCSASNAQQWEHSLVSMALSTPISLQIAAFAALVRWSDLGGGASALAAPCGRCGLLRVRRTGVCSSVTAALVVL